MRAEEVMGSVVQPSTRVIARMGVSKGQPRVTPIPLFTRIQLPVKSVEEDLRLTSKTSASVRKPIRCVTSCLSLNHLPFALGMFSTETSNQVGYKCFPPLGWSLGFWVAVKQPDTLRVTRLAGKCS